MSGSASRMKYMYENLGYSIPKVSDATGVPRSTVRYTLLSNNVKLRPRVDAARKATKGKPSPFKGIKRPPFSESWKANISKGRRAWADKHAKGVSLKPSGYLEITRGPNKGKSIHVAIMEEKLGRPLLEDECCHHIDRDRTNNNLNNLALVTRSGHMRLHRYEDLISGNLRKRDENGRFS